MSVTLVLLVHISSKSEYQLPVGTQDRERLIALNELLNPNSINFLSRYLKPGNHVLELGAGIGIMSQEIAKIVGNMGRVVATDISTEQLEIAHTIAKDGKLPWLKFEYADAYDLSHINGQFDAVYMRQLLIHLDNPFKVIEQVKQVLKPEGVLLIEDLCGNPSEDVYCTPYDARIEQTKEFVTLALRAMQLNVKLSQQLKYELPLHGFELLFYAENQAKADTLNARCELSLTVESLRPLLIKKQVTTNETLNEMKQAIQSLGEDLSIELFDFKVSKIAARFRG